jgi:hypothetical protein
VSRLFDRRLGASLNQTNKGPASDISVRQDGPTNQLLILNLGSGTQVSTLQKLATVKVFLTCVMCAPTLFTGRFLCRTLC